MGAESDGGLKRVDSQRKGENERERRERSLPLLLQADVGDSIKEGRKR